MGRLLQINCQPGVSLFPLRETFRRSPALRSPLHPTAQRERAAQSRLERFVNSAPHE
jgi:hypothetical protein